MPTWKKILLEGDTVPADNVPGGEFPDSGYTFAGSVGVDHINEKTADHGVEIDGLLIKDGAPDLPFVDWTPTIAQNGAVAVTVDEAKYHKLGALCHVYGKLTVTGAGSADNGIVISGQPTEMQPAVTNIFAGTCSLYDASSGAVYIGTLMVAAAWNFSMWNPAGGYIGANPSLALAAGDVITFEIAYRVAA